MQLLKLGNSTDCKLKYYRSENLLAKQFLIQLIQGNVLYLKYLPDSIKLDKLSKSFLFTVSNYIISQLIASIEPQIYRKLYEIYKNKESQKAFKKLDDYEISLSENIINDVASFKPINR